MNAQQQSDIFNLIIARSWDDAVFKQKLLDDPIAVLEAEGLPIRAGMQIKVLENNDHLVHLVLPSGPSVPSTGESS